jgi:hypothetical protein
MKDEMGENITLTGKVRILELMDFELFSASVSLKNT